MMMKKLIALLILSVFVANCGDGDKKKTPNNSDVPVQKQDKSTEKPDDNPKLTEDLSNISNNSIKEDKEPIYNPDVEVGKPKLNENLLIACKQRSRLSGCKLNGGIIADVKDLDEEKTYLVKYIFPCKGHEPFVGIKVGYNKQLFTFTYEEKEIEMTGKGPVEIFSYNESRTARASLNRGCRLEVLEITPQENMEN